VGLSLLVCGVFLFLIVEWQRLRFQRQPGIRPSFRSEYVIQTAASTDLKCSGCFKVLFRQGEQLSNQSFHLTSIEIWCRIRIGEVDICNLSFNAVRLLHVSRLHFVALIPR